MTEIGNIIASYNRAHAAGKKTALATVVKVEGSSYRQPGARMLVTEDGILTGAISGGCLEGDALRKALLAINQKQNKLITYDTSDESILEFSVQLGCNGIVHILFEYIDSDNPHNPLDLLKKVEENRTESVITMLFSLERNARQIGTVHVFQESESFFDDQYSLEDESLNILKNKYSQIKNIQVENEEQSALFQYIAPPVSLVIAGAGNDVQPVVKMADILGWEVTVGEGRVTHATQKRFPEAKNVLVVKPEELIQNIVIDERTYFVLMTHNYKYDLEVLKLVLKTNCPYIGILGPKTKLQRMFDDLHADGNILTDEDYQRIYGPIGLDIGAETSEEIALSVISEIKAVIEDRKGTSLRYKIDKIHGQPAAKHT
ncbi:XdhC family protein [Chryseobacterium luquanense]|uniref:XdhC family protein n=1 Tax=Chryseobacterium luquanense TaxID=2983766 RepID=A0ABT3XY06_9FLAO|nr:XdhC/CoxI family protein [Chryseobacterium luquanense]MCX8530746.1 XdhC family protein [Chryseobacterium luquanense]